MSSDLSMAVSRAGRRGPTIGVIMDNIFGESRSSLWPGIADTVRAHGGRLLCFAGGYLHDPDDFSRRGNFIYDLIDSGRLDGLIVWASSLASYVGFAALRRFCDRYRPLPMVSIGVTLEGIPGILLDSYDGMKQVMRHLITVHGRRRLAFVRGPEGHRDADERYRAYLDALQEFGLPLLPELISPCYKWYEPGGRAAVELFLDERRASFDAVVCVNDQVAVDAMDTLRAHGLRVPEDVSVTGFDNTPLGRLVTPPLTSVPWRMYERGRQAVNLLMALMAGEPAPAQVLLPTRLVVRQSCGCPDPAVVLAAGELSRPVVEDVAFSAPAVRSQCLAALSAQLDGTERAEQFLDAFLADLSGEAVGGFLPALEAILRQEVAAGSDVIAWQGAISVLRRQLLPYLVAQPALLVRGEDLWHQARVMIGDYAFRVRGYREWLAQNRAQRLQRISHCLATSGRLSDLMDVLAEELPGLGIGRCYLALYDDPSAPGEWCRLLLAYDEHGRVDLGPEGRLVRARDLAMGELLPPDQRESLLLLPLVFQEDRLGLVMFDQKVPGDFYAVLQEAIGVALKSVMLSEQSARLYRQAVAAQEAAQEGRRLAEEADRLKSRFLSMVSHELRTPLILLVGLSEMLLRERTGDRRPPLPEPYRQDLARIHVSAQQLDGLVRDVLDLARSQTGQLRLIKAPLDMSQILRPVALIGEQMARAKGLEWQAIIPDALPTVYGDASRLRQVTLNLVTNAVKFTEAGRIVLMAETDGASVTVSVSDTGPGVPLDEQEAIFDEFRQSERTAARGYGGLGIGLAICRELVELHGGQIGVHSSGEEEGGSTFYFTLPVWRQEKEAARRPASQTVVLLTAGSADGHHLVESLRRDGFQATSLCLDGHPNWLDALLALAPGAVLLDCEPASARGWQVIEALRGHPALHDVPVFFYALPRPDAGAMLALGHLTKPVEASALREALERYGLTPAVGSGSRSILVVDDDPHILDLHARLVAEALPDCRVLRAANGRIALELMRSERPSLVLLDLMMPELDGMAVLAAMQEDERLRGIPVIVVTAQTLTQREMEQLNRGVAAVLQKGLFTAEETLAHIEAALTRSKRLGSEAQRTTRKAMAYIHEHYAEPISREDVAAHIGVSARHLTRCFHQEMGVSPITYLSRYRIERAKRLLEAGDRTITEVAIATGFASSSYFADAFRRETGMSPREYQRRALAPKS